MPHGVGPVHARSIKADAFCEASRRGQGELRNVGIDDDSALLGVVGLEADSKIYLKVRPYVHRPKEGKPPWCGTLRNIGRGAGLA